MTDTQPDTRADTQADTQAATHRLEQDVERQREQLARTVDALHAKLDVKSRAKDGLTTQDGKPKPVVLAVAAFAVTAVAAYVVVRARRR